MKTSLIILSCLLKRPEQLAFECNRRPTIDTVSKKYNYFTALIEANSSYREEKQCCGDVDIQNGTLHLMWPKYRKCID